MNETIGIVKDFIAFGYRCFPPAVIYLIMPFVGVGLFFKVMDRFNN